MRLKTLVPLALLLCSALPVRAETLTFAPLPMESTYTVASQWQPLFEYLEKSLGMKLKISYSATNDEVVNRFLAGELDLAYLGPLPYLKLKKNFPAAEPVVIFKEGDGQPFYSCALVSADGGFDLQAMKGKKVALTQPLSTCGYFATEGILAGHGTSLESNHYHFLGQHDKVALAVARGDFDAGGLKTNIARKFNYLGVIVRAESPLFPGLALVANSQRVPAQRIAQLREVLQAADEATRQSWGDNIRFGVVPARDSDYDGMRRYPFPASFPSQGNMTMN